MVAEAPVDAKAKVAARATITSRSLIVPHLFVFLREGAAYTLYDGLIVPSTSHKASTAPLVLLNDHRPAQRRGVQRIVVGVVTCLVENIGITIVLRQILNRFEII